MRVEETQIHQSLVAAKHTRLIHMWIHLLVKNQYSGVPSLGNMCGYRLVFCACLSCSESGGPGYWRGGLRCRRCGCDGVAVDGPEVAWIGRRYGGRNLSGFSSRMALGGMAVDEAWRAEVWRAEMRRTIAARETS